MHIMELEPRSVPWVLRAMKSVALADGASHALEDEMIAAAADPLVRVCNAANTQEDKQAIFF